MEVISAWELYLWTRLGVFSPGVAAIVLVSLILWFAIKFDNSTKDYFEENNMGRFTNAIIACVVTFILLCVALPSKKDMAMIYVIPKIANNEMIQQEAGEIYTIAKEALKEYLPTKEEPAK